MEETTQQKIRRWLSTAMGMVGVRRWPSDFPVTSETNPDTALVSAYHAGVRDTLVRLLQESELEEIREVYRVLREDRKYRGLL